MGSQLRSQFLRLARHRHVVTVLAIVGLVVTFGLMLGLHATTTLGAVAFAPWVGLIGFDAGVWAGVLTAAGSTGLWLLAASHEGSHVSGLQTGVRIGYLALLGFGTAVAGRRLHASERARRSTVALQRALIDATLDGICLTDDRGHILIVNEPLARMAIELGMPAAGTVPERLLSIADKLADPGSTASACSRSRTRPGRRRRTSSSSWEPGASSAASRPRSPTRRGTFVGRIWTLREVTADKELERMRDAFVATVSHELRTPLTSISGFIEMLQDEQHLLGESGRMYLDVIRRSADRLQQLVEDLLLVAQIEAKRVDLQHEPVDLAEVARQSLESMRAWATEKGVRLELAADTRRDTLGDARRLGQVLDNLFSNAIKFSRTGGYVTVEVGGDRETVYVVVADTGIGIPADEQGTCSRASTARARRRAAVPGTGLGLAITRALVDQHGGTVELESRQGEGTG